MNCPKCNEPIHPERLKLGYKTCVKCSTEKRYGYVHVFEGKTADKIQVIKDPKLAERLTWMQKRRNFGVANGMYKKQK